MMLCILLALKLAHVDMYARKLVEREKRKRCGVYLSVSAILSVFVLFVISTLTFFLSSIAKQHGLIGGKQRVSGEFVQAHMTWVCMCICVCCYT